jgi:hypothetical protein
VIRDLSRITHHESQINQGGFQMNERKSFLVDLAETIDRHLPRRSAPQSDPTPSQPGRLGLILRWLTPNGGTLLLIAALILTQNVWARQMTAPAAPGPGATTVNYQGRLADSGGIPLDGTYGMSFSLWDAATDGNLVWGPENHTAVPVSEGLFSVGLGSQTSGGIPTTTWNGDHYLEITVGGETLSPREIIRSVPIAGMALTVPDAAIGTEQIADGAITSAKLASGGLPNAILDGASEQVLIQAGQIQNTSGTSPGYINVTFEQPFKTGTIPRVVVSPNNRSGIWPLGWYVVLQDHSGFKIYRESEFPTAWDWIAIGESE